MVRMAAGPDFTLRGLRAELAERGTEVSYDAVWRFVRQARLTFKKSLRASRIALTLPVSGCSGGAIKDWSRPAG